MYTTYPRWKGRGDNRRARLYHTTPSLAYSRTRLSFNASALSQNWTDFGRIRRTIDTGEYGGGVYTWTVTMKTSTISVPARARIFNITDNIEVEGSQLETISLSAVEIISQPITLSGKKSYKVQIGNFTLIPEAPPTPSADGTLLLRLITTS